MSLPDPHPTPPPFSPTDRKRRPAEFRGDGTKPATTVSSLADGNDVIAGENSPALPFALSHPRRRGREYKTKSYTRDIISRRGRAFRESRRNGPGNNSKVSRGTARVAASPARSFSFSHPLAPPLFIKRSARGTRGRARRPCACLSA